MPSCTRKYLLRRSAGVVPSPPSCGADRRAEQADELVAEILSLQEDEDGHDEDDQRTFEGGKDGFQHARASEIESGAGGLTSTGIDF